MSQTVIEVKNLSKKYKDTMAVDNVSFKVKPTRSTDCWEGTEPAKRPSCR